jgi:predicted dehydrogenase
VKPNRREFIGAAAAAISLFHGPLAARAQTKPTTRSRNDRPRIAMIGCGGIANFHAVFALKHADIVALCDVDQNHLDQYNQKHAAGKAFVTPDYRKLLERKDVDLVWICTPDHWHTKIAIDAMRAGKELYLEKPATLTVEEGQQLCRAARETARVVQVGTQQRQDEKFLTAVALAHGGRLGRIQKVTVAVGDTPAGQQFSSTAPPDHLDWELWLGQAPLVDYTPHRVHNAFRWWYEYSGGRMTDWGAHHVDIAQWAAAPDAAGPVTIEPLMVEHPVPFKDGHPTIHDGYNTAARFNVRCTFANGVELFVRDRFEDREEDNGIHIEGDRSFCFVNRAKLTGPAVNALKDDPLPERHIAEFIECARSRSMPRSDVWSHHRMLTTCHLANIAMRLGRKITWDATTERISGDDEANSFLSRPQRKGYETA